MGQRHLTQGEVFYRHIGAYHQVLVVKIDLESGLEYSCQHGLAPMIQEPVSRSPGGNHIDDTFFLTWGDGVSDVNLEALLDFHRSHGKTVTVTAVHPPARFGQLVLDGEKVTEFSEKPLTREWINGAFFVCEPEVFEFIPGDDTLFEKEPLEKLAANGELMAYRHDGFWQPMDTMRDKVHLQRLWDGGDPPWRTWQ